MQKANNSRKLLILQGDVVTLYQKITDFVIKYQGDWITITPQLNLPTNFKKCILPQRTKALLGREFKHAIFDAIQGFNLDALAMLAGTLVQGSLLILLLPEKLTTWADADSLRWNENNYPITVPNFISHLLNVIDTTGLTITHITANTTLSITDFDKFIKLGVSDQIALQEQQHTLQQIKLSNKPIIVLMAKRGRGKSALAGLFTYVKQCTVTAPNKESLSTFFHFAKETTPFYAPDQIIKSPINKLSDYLIIDEAAMIPLSLLEKLLALNCRFLLTTTVDGYEGTGQGFLLKLLQHKSVDFFCLDTPIRWQANDELEQFVDKLLLNENLSDNYDTTITCQSIDYSIVSRQDIKTLKQIYALLKMAHYRTTSVDLRRLLDASKLSIWQAKQNDKVIAALIAIQEGGLSDHLIDDVWLGARRPKGNLVAQSLVAHAGEKLAAKLLSVRINRIAVAPLYRRQGIAITLVNSLATTATSHHTDFLSVSFAYSIANYQFWTACGFTLVHVASHKEASSGSHSVMAIRPITTQGQKLVDKLYTKLQRNWYWLQKIIKLELNIAVNCNQHLSLDDKAELHGFALYHRPYEATYAALCRLNQTYMNKTININTPILNALIQNNQLELEIIKNHKLTGHHALMQALKQEVRQLLKIDDNSMLSK